MTSGFVFFELYDTFSEAKTTAVELAQTHGNDIRVAREGERWKVLVPEWIHEELTNPPPDDEPLLTDEELEDDLEDNADEDTDENEQRTCGLCGGFGHSPVSRSDCPQCLGSGQVSAYR